MKHTIKKYFIPHEGNNYHPHFLHSKRALLYSALFLASKAIIVVLALAIPLPALVTPDVIIPEQERILALVNNIRAENGRPALREVAPLDRSATLKANDMVAGSYFSHTGPNGRTLKYFLTNVKYDYKTAGENLAMGYSDADQLVAAWVESPTHYQNLIDADYVENGIGMAGGEYNNLPTVYTAMHFGARKQPVVSPVTTVSTTNFVEPKVSSKPVVVESTTTAASSTVLGEIIAKPINQTVQYNNTDSFVSWEPHESGTKVTATVYLSGLATNVLVQIKDTKLPLVPATETPDNYVLYTGETVVPHSPQELFAVVLPPSIIYTDSTGKQILDTVRWDRVEVVAPTMVQKYVLAEKTTSYLSTIISFTRSVYVIFFVLFAMALTALIIGAFNKKRHHHVAMQTLSLLGLLAALAIS